MIEVKIAAKESGDYLISEDVHTGIIVQMIHIGTQTSPVYGVSDKMIIVYEISDDLITKGDDAGKPKQTSQYVNLVMGSEKKPSNLREVILAVEGRSMTKEELEDYNIMTMIGKHVQVNITHDKKGEVTKARITQHGVSKLHKSMERPAPFAELKALYLPVFDKTVFDSLPEWIKKQVNMNDVPVSLKPAVDF
jgi:hypothetical protein